MKHKILTVLGARPQFIKAAAVSPLLDMSDRIEELIIHTGQHYDKNMSDVFFDELGIKKPFANLGVSAGTHGQNTGRAIEKIEQVLIEEQPSAVIVYGDTDTTLAASIATSKLGIVLVHIEAGLRSFRRSMPEEINRVVTDHVSDILYTTSPLATSNLRNEGIPESKITCSGDVMYDATLRFLGLSDTASNALAISGLRKAEYHYMTLHRKENVDERSRLKQILQGLAKSDKPIVFPVHPRTAKRIRESDVIIPDCIKAIEPVGYLDSLQLTANSHTVLTDSGGLQKEAYFLGKPCLIFRDETEWVELVENRASVLVGASAEDISQRLLETNWPETMPDIYGNGKAAKIIVEDLISRLDKIE